MGLRIRQIFLLDSNIITANLTDVFKNLFSKIYAFNCEDLTFELNYLYKLIISEYGLQNYFKLNSLVYSYFIPAIFLGFLQAYYPEQREVNTKLRKYYLLLSLSMKLGTANRMKLLQLIEYYISSIDLPPTLFSFQISLNKVVLYFVLFSAFNALNFDQLLNDKFQTQCWQVSFDSNISAVETVILKLVLQLNYSKIWINAKNHDQLVAQFTEIKLQHRITKMTYQNTNCVVYSQQYHQPDCNIGKFYIVQK
ncbi:Hypothetical_protein [Hexamita inflata]|uniref:Hypothetical_protein n=1 Tax=Hexamita inflata TaxID=28002 RepID=A0AA86N777_9EUKA|nr:Hypothetical protein HINF_LOCUS1369 [Hexamita inflata]